MLVATGPTEWGIRPYHAIYLLIEGLQKVLPGIAPKVLTILESGKTDWDGLLAMAESLEWEPISRPNPADIE